MRMMIGVFVFALLFGTLQSAEAQVATNVDVTDFSIIIKGKDAQLVDVRTPKEFAVGKIKGAMNIDYYGKNFRNEIANLDREKTIAVYCRSGNRSGRAMSILKDLGFRKVYNLSGGMMGWQSRNMPIVK